MALELISLEEAIKLGLGESSLVVPSRAKRPLAVKPRVSSGRSNHQVSLSVNETKESSEVLEEKNGN